MTTNDKRLDRLDSVAPRSADGRAWRSGGVAVSVMTCDDAGVEADEPWIASCDTHGEMIACGTKRAAESAARNRDWCSGCRGDRLPPDAGRAAADFRQSRSVRADGRGHWPAGVPRHAPADHWPKTLASLRVLLEQHGRRGTPISAAALARAIGVSDTSVRRWVAGRFAPPIELQDEIAVWAFERILEVLPPDLARQLAEDSPP